MELVERAYRLPVFDLHLQAILQGELPSFDPPQPDRFLAKSILFAEKDIRAPDTYPWLDRGVRDVPHPGEQISAGQPVCTLFASGGSRQACLDNLIAGAESLKGEIYA
jgi:predicted ATP-grasp superfamily ATP-dependent carboligase